MPTVNATSTFGQSKWKAHAEVTAEQAQVLSDLGFLWVMQRTPSSTAEKAIAGYEKRPDGFKRGEMPFDDQFVKILTANLQNTVEIADDDEITPVVDSVKFHEIGAGKEPAYAEEKRIVTRHITAKDIITWNDEKVKFTGEGDLDTDNVEFLKAVKAYKQRILADS